MKIHYKKSSLFFIALSTLLISSCSKDVLTFGDQVKNRGEQYQQIGNDWKEGDNIMKEGMKIYEKGQKMMEEGKLKIAEAEKFMQEGNALVEKGNFMKNQAQQNYNASVAPTVYQGTITQMPIYQTMPPQAVRQY